MRAKSIQHADYEIIEHLLGEIDLAGLKALMCDDEHSTKRFDAAAKNLCDRLTAMADVRRKNLPKGHPDRTEA